MPDMLKIWKENRKAVVICKKTIDMYKYYARIVRKLTITNKLKYINIVLCTLIYCIISFKG